MSLPINPKFISQDMATDAELSAASTEDRKRENHTGTQAASTIHDFSTAVQSSIGYTPENALNKTTNLSSPDNIKYPTTQAVSTALLSKFNTPGGTTSQYIRGDGSLADFPALSGLLTKGTKTIFCIDNGDYATGQAAINAASPGDTVMFGVKSGGWGDLVIPAGKKLSLIGLQSRRAVMVQVGSISFAPTTGLNTNENELYIESLFITSNSANALSFGGTAPSRIRLNGCYIYTSGATTQLCNFTNSNSLSSWYIYDSILLTANSQDVIRNSANYGRIFYSTIDSVGILIKNTAGLIDVRECILSTNFTGNAVEVSGGSILCGYSQIANSGTNASGVLVSAGALFAGSYNSFAVTSGTGYCVRGTGYYVYGPTVFANSAIGAYNVKVQNTLTNLPITTTFTSAP